ncbi:STAS domain-containing protein [Geodermatophilus sp. SYSU D00696]
MHVDPGSGRLTLTGPLDARAAHLLYDAVSALLAARHPAWTVDVGGVTGIDDAGLRALLGAYRRAVRHGCRVGLRGASPALRDTLVLLRLDRHLLPGECRPIAEEPGPG